MLQEGARRGYKQCAGFRDNPMLGFSSVAACKHMWMSTFGLDRFGRAGSLSDSDLQRQAEAVGSDLTHCNKVLGMDSPVGVVLPMVIQLANVQSIGIWRAVFRRVAFSVSCTQHISNNLQHKLDQRAISIWIIRSARQRSRCLRCAAT